MELKVNLINELGKYRKGYFTSTESILDELVQNAQRAKAESIQILFNEEKGQIEVLDNGCGCDSIEALITKSQSGWDSNTMVAESPAGEGMYSVAMIANKLQFISKASCTFNFGKIFTETPSLDIVELGENNIIDKGSYLIISDIIDTYTLKDLYESWSAYARGNLLFVDVEVVLAYNDDMTKVGKRLPIYIENHLQADPINKVIETDDYIFIYDAAEHRTAIELYYQNRYVRQMHSSFVGVGGKLIIKNNKIIGVRLPDRKDVVSDNRLEALRYSISLNMVKYLVTLSPENINEAADSLFNNISNNFWSKVIEDMQFLSEFKCVWSHKRNAAITADEFMNELSTLPDDEVIYGFNKYSYNKPETEVIQNNVYNGREVYEYGRGFYNLLIELYDGKLSRIRRAFELPLFKGYTKPFSICRSMGTSQLVKELANLTDYIYRTIEARRYSFETKYTIHTEVKPAWEVAEVSISDNFRFAGLCNRTENKILLNWNLLKTTELIKTKKEARQFIIDNSEVILHELAHFIFYTEDKTVEHAEVQIKLYGIFINYLLQ